MNTGEKRITKHYQFDNSFDTGNIKELISRYHFKDTDYSCIKGVVDEVNHNLKVDAFVVYAKERINATVTLGMEFDDLQELYVSNGKLLESYILECLGSELLNQAYQRLQLQIIKETGLKIKKFLFPGSDTSLENVGVILESLSQTKVRYNDAYVLIPKKSVVFEGILSSDNGVMECNVCDTCSNHDCINRRETKARNYGYHRIFGNGRRKE